MSEELQDDIRAWAEKQPDNPPLAPAIRRLVELGLKDKTPATPISKPVRASRARELAAETIDKIIDPSAPPEERAQRRSRLTKGPEEFQEARVDRPKVKTK